MYHTTPADPEKKVGMGVLMYLDIVIVLPTWYKINTFVTYLPHQKIAKMEALEHQILELPFHQGKGSCTIHSLKTMTAAVTLVLILIFANQVEKNQQLVAANALFPVVASSFGNEKET